MKNIRKILCMVLCVSVLVGCMFTVLSIGAYQATSDGLYIPKQDDSGYYPESPVALDYPADNYVANKKLESIPQTLEAWVFIPSTLGNKAAGPIFGNFCSETSYGEAFINYEIGENRHPRIWWGDEFAYNQYDITFENTTVPENKWTHVSFVYDNDSGIVSCYLNGVASESKYFYPALCYGVTDFPFVLGGDQRIAHSEYFKGELKDVAVFSTVRSAEQIAADYVSVDYAAEGLLCYYDIDADAMRADIPDKTGNGYDLIYSKSWLTESEMEQIRAGWGDFESDYSFAVFGDTQKMTEQLPNMLTDMYQWVADNKDSKNIVYSLGLGDITDDNGGNKFSKDANGKWVSDANGEYDEWDVAKEAISRLNGKVPYSIVRGNHDIMNSRDYFNQTFSDVEWFTSQFEGENGGKYTDTGVKDPVTSATVSYANTWCAFTVTVDGTDINYLFLNLDYGASDEVLAWASSVISQERFADHKVIVSTHAYTYADGDPEDMGDATPPSIMRDFMNNGDEIWDSFVSKHPNIYMMLSGHITSNEILVNRVNAEIDDKINVVTEMLINPQAIDYRFRSGMIAMFYFDESENKVAVEWYSPSRNAYYLSASQYLIDLNSPGVDRVPEKWDGATLTQPEGEGTQENPYLISSPSNLLWMSKTIIDSKEGACFAGKYFLQTCDIDLDGKAIQSIGYYFQNFKSMSAFSGNYDGAGYSIKNGTIASVEGNHAFTTYYGHGLFGVIYGAVIENVVLENIEVVGRGVTGAIVGRAASPEIAVNGDFVNFNIISGCEVKDTVRITTLRPDSTFKESEYFDNPLKAGRVGSVCGMVHGTLIEGCISAAKFKLSGDFTLAGGIAGTAGLNTVIDNCAFVGEITLVDNTAASDSAYGGIVGAVSPGKLTSDEFGKATGTRGDLSVTNCYVTGKYSYTGADQSKNVTYGTVTGYSESDGIYTENNCSENQSDSVDSAIASIKNDGSERIWLINVGVPAGVSAEGSKYLDHQSGKYYTYTSGAWTKISELGMASNSLETPYGNITAEYITSPMVVFKYEKGAWVFVAGYDSYFEMNDAIRDICDSDTNQKAVCYFRGDVTLDKNTTNLAWNIGTIIFDLGGNTIYQANSKYFFPAVAKFIASFAKNPTLYSSPGYFEVKNGNIVLNDKGLFEISAYGEAYNSYATNEIYKKFYYNFSNVNISLAEGSNLTQLFGSYGESGTVCHSSSQKAELFVKFEDSCTIDITNAEKKINLFNANDSLYSGPSGKTNGDGIAYNYTNSITHIEVGAVNIISDSKNFTWFTVNSDNGSSVVFAKGTNGEMANLTLPSGVTPTTDVNLPGKDGYVYDIYKKADADSAIYTLYTPSTPYADITDEFADVEKYPFAVFKYTAGEWVFSKGYSSFADATYAAISSTVGGYRNVVYVRRNTDTNYPSNNINWNVGTLVIDLGGHTVTPTEYFLPAYAKYRGSPADNAVYDDPGYYEIINGEIKLGNYGLFKIGALGSPYDKNATATSYKNMYFSFDNVKFSLKEGSTLSSITGYYDDKQNTIGIDSKESKYMGIHISYGDGCVFDITNATAKINLFNANDSITEGVMGQNKAGNDYYAVNTIMSIEVGAVSVIAKDANFTWYTVNNDNGSSVTFIPDGDGYFFSLSVPEGTSVTTTTKFKDNRGESHSIAKVRNESGRDIYTIPSLIVTPYCNISSSYEQYKMVIFLKNADGSYSLSGTKGYDVFATALDEARKLTTSEVGSEAVVYFLDDVISTTYVSGNFGYSIGTVIIDLNYKTLTAAADEPLIRAYAKYRYDPSALPDSYYANAYYFFKNGTIVLNSEGLFRIGMESKDYDQYVNGAPHYKTLYWTFDDIDIKLAKGATLTSLLGEYNESTHCGSMTEGNKTMGIDVTFNDNCTIDISEATKNVTLFDANDTNYSGKSGSITCTNSVVTVTVGAIRIIAGDKTFKIANINENNGSSVTFVMDNNYQYATLVLKNGTVAPAVEANEGMLGFVKIKEENGNSVYTLVPKEALSFVPSMSLTLDRNLILNVYIPAKNILHSFTLDGVEYTDLGNMETVILGDESYFLVKISLDAKTAARDVVLKAKISLGDRFASATFTFGVIKYAEKVIADGSDVEQTLVKDVLSYIRAAYIYFDTDDAQTVSRITEVLGDNYDVNNAPMTEGSPTENTSGFESVTFVLDGTPSMRFYLESGADASKYAFFIDGTRVKTETAADGTYIDIDVYAYALCETVSCTIDGAESGSFHINAYYEWTKTQNNADLENLVARFWKYLQSARAYREESLK